MRVSSETCRAVCRNMIKLYIVASCWTVIDSVYVAYIANCQLLSNSFLFCAFLYSNCVFNFPAKCPNTTEYLYCLLNIWYMFRHSLRHPQGELVITSQKQPTVYCEVVTMLLQCMTFITCFLQSCLQLLTTILARCCGLKVF